MKMILGGLRQPNVHSDIAGWSPSSYAFVFNKRANCGVIAFRFFKCEKCSNRGIKKTIALQGCVSDAESWETTRRANQQPPQINLHMPKSTEDVPDNRPLG